MRSCALLGSRLLATAIVFFALAPAVPAQELRFAGAQDIATLDPHQRNDAFTNRILHQVYEPLISRNAKLELVPNLALHWKTLSATQWQVDLREGVRFADGSPLSASDVVFSIQRAQQRHSSLRHYAIALGKVSAVSAHLLRFDTEQANPVFPEQLSLIPIMSKTWSEAQRCASVGDPAARQETPCTRQSNGTGPMKVKAWSPAASLRLERNPGWWGREQAGLGNLQFATYLPMPSETARMVALVNREIDLVLDPRPTDLPSLTARSELVVHKSFENRTVFLGFDQSSPRLRMQAAATSNPLKDLRVRQALAHAIDSAAIQSKILRDLAVPTFSMVVPAAKGYVAEQEVKPVFDIALARSLLAQAGYPGGFTLAFGCPNDRHPTDVPLCTAIATMWSKIGVTAKLQTLPKAVYFDTIARQDQGFDAFLMSWGGATTDAQFTLVPVIHGVSAKGEGSDNYGRAAVPAIDTLIDQARTEMNPAKRESLLRQALIAHNAQLMHLPLHRQMVIWAASKKIELTVRPDGRLDLIRTSLR